MTPAEHDVVIVGGGHNGLVAAAYLAAAGRSVLLLERDDHVGGAAVSAQAFAGIDARLSRYSYLVSLLPQRIIDDLGLDIRLVRRRYSSYTPDPHDPNRGLLIDNADGDATRASFASLGAETDAAAWQDFYAQTGRMARSLFPTLVEPLPTRDDARRLVADDDMWNAVVERPLGEVIIERFASDLVRGVVATDGLIGTFADLEDASLDANRCFLYHVIGGGTGDWDVPIGGMGSVSGALERSARKAGAQVVTGADVLSVSADGDVRYVSDGDESSARGSWVLANVAPVVLERLMDGDGDRDLDRQAPVGRVGRDEGAALSRPAPALDRQGWPEGAQVKVNLLLTRLPRLLDEAVEAEAAFGGTFHINEGYSQLQNAYAQAADGAVPEVIPCEIYCHSLSDPSILSPELAASGAQTLTVFALHVPDRLVNAENADALRASLQAAVLASLNSVLAEPVEDVLMTDANGDPCIETKTTFDIERALGMPGGNIFHGPLSWPFLDEDEPRDTAAQRWGVATRHPRVLICGSGARRGGAVSGIGGHNAAMAVLEGD